MTQIRKFVNSQKKQSGAFYSERSCPILLLDGVTIEVVLSDILVSGLGQAWTGFSEFRFLNSTS